jgi:ATP-dependent DNA ligase
MSVYEILQELEATSSKNEKEAILLKHKNDETLKRCFELAYSPTIQFYIKQLPEVSVLDSANKHNIQLIPSQVVNTMEEAKEVFRNYVDQGYEGIILKNRGGFWADKRSSDLVKFKEELFADLRVVGYYEGEGKAQGMLGGLSLESEDGVIKVNVGSGFTDEQRKQIWQDKNLGIVEIKYNGITEDKKTGQKSLFLPIFIRERLDKSVANTWDEMQ